MKERAFINIKQKFVTKVQKKGVLTKKEKDVLYADFYKPILEKQLSAIKNQDGVYELKNWLLYPEKNLAINENSSLRMTLHYFVRDCLNPMKNPLKEKEVIFKKRYSKLGDIYKFIYCCKCKEKVKAIEIFDKKKGYFYKCGCGLKVETDNNRDFPQPISYIQTQEIKKDCKDLNELINSFCKRNIKKRVKLCNFVREKTKSLFQFKPELIKSVEEGRKVYKIIDNYINQGLVNVKRI